MRLTTAILTELRAPLDPLDHPNHMLHLIDGLFPVHVSAIIAATLLAQRLCG